MSSLLAILLTHLLPIQLSLMAGLSLRVPKYLSQNSSSSAHLFVDSNVIE